ncbi:hypothetical protein Cgig2_014385 [Carnegiea gigantea]|uniref:Uncharacterized protein n=1 Tax=Carnegiea gigantea TaxID=171969 RepID=A0A9Q1JPW3_9CARY|nr:hypothetical protein Cgig2_014385 [Carnegiea gigantea]
MEDNSKLIDVDSNGEEEVAKTDNKHARKTTTIQTGAYKKVGDDKPPKHQRKLTSTIWEHYEFLEPNEDGMNSLNLMRMVDPRLAHEHLKPKKWVSFYFLTQNLLLSFRKMTSMEDNSMAIAVDSNQEEEVVKTDNRHARKTITIQTSPCKPVAGGKPPKCQRTLTSIV